MRFQRIKRYYDALIKRPHIVFATVGATFGLLFIVLIPPFQTPDEHMHLARAYQVATFDTNTHASESGRLYAQLPVSFTKTQTAVQSFLTEPGNGRYDFSATARSASIPLNPSKTVSYDVTNTTVYPSLAYVPQAAAIALLKLFDAPIIFMMYAARLATLAVWIFLGVVAIRLTPIRKWTFAILALLPMMVAQSIAPGIDMLTVGLSLLLLALILRARESGQPSRYDYVMIGTVAALVPMTKPVNIVLLLLLFFVPIVAKRPSRRALGRVALIAAPLLLFVVWMVGAGLENMSAPQGKGDTDGQIRYILSQPQQFAEAIFNTFTTTSSDLVTRSFIGNFGWLNAPMPLLGVVFGYCLLAYVLFVRYERKDIIATAKARWLWGGIVAAYCLTIVASMYVGWSAVASDVVDGLQGRYFLAVPFLLIPLLATIHLASVSQTKYVKTALIGTIILLVMATFSLVMRYYWPFHSLV